MTSSMNVDLPEQFGPTTGSSRTQSSYRSSLVVPSG